MNKVTIRIYQDGVCYRYQLIAASGGEPMFTSHSFLTRTHASNGVIAMMNLIKSKPTIIQEM